MPSDAEDIAQLKTEVARLTGLVNGLYRHLGIGQAQAQAIAEGDLDNDAEILDEIRSGNLIMAIKLYRERTGMGLAEAKLAVEDIARQHGLG